MDRLDNLERELHIPQHTDNIRAVLRSLSSNADSKFGLLSKTASSLRYERRKFFMDRSGK